MSEIFHMTLDAAVLAAFLLFIFVAVGVFTGAI